MASPRCYHFPPTALIPNSPRPLLHYPSTLFPSAPNPALAAHDLFATNTWRTQWIFRYGPTQQSHYHSRSHECMAVLSGSATIRFGVADAEAQDPNALHLNDSNPPIRNGEGDGDEGAAAAGEVGIGGHLEIRAHAGDVFVIPAGVAHKTFDPSPGPATFELLTPGHAHQDLATRAGAEPEQNVREALAQIELSGFTMLGAYPEGSQWDFQVGGEDRGAYEAVWSVDRPERDPVLGKAEMGLCGLWT